MIELVVHGERQLPSCHQRREVHHADGLLREGPRGLGSGLDRRHHVQRELVRHACRGVHVQHRALPAQASRTAVPTRVSGSSSVSRERAQRDPRTHVRLRVPWGPARNPPPRCPKPLSSPPRAERARRGGAGGRGWAARACHRAKPATHQRASARRGRTCEPSAPLVTKPSARPPPPPGSCRNVLLCASAPTNLGRQEGAGGGSRCRSGILWEGGNPSGASSASNCATGHPEANPL